MDNLCGKNGWDVVLCEGKDGKILGAWPFEKKRKYGIRKIGQPILTPHIGPVIVFPHNLTKQERKLSHEFKVLEDLTKKLNSFKVIKQSLNPIIQNWSPMYWQDFIQSTRYTYILNEIKNHSQIWEGFKSSLKNDIRKAKESYRIEKEDHVENLFRLCKTTFDRKGREVPISFTNLETLYKALNQIAKIEVHTCFSAGQPVSSCMTVFDDHKAYAILIGVDKSLQARGANQWTIWESILSASKKVDIFDFEGSMLKEVEKVFRAFGGTPVPFLTVSKAPSWFKLLYKLKRGRDFSL